MLRSSKPAGLVSLPAYDGIATEDFPSLTIYGHYQFLVLHCIALHFIALMSEVLVTFSLHYVNDVTQLEVAAI